MSNDLRKLVATVLNGPCMACPYRRDVAPGVWHPEEYAKLPPYDRPTGEQPLAAFMCHATPEHYCHGWAVCHSNRGHEHELLSLRLRGVDHIPPATVPLFGSGREAADHGLSALSKVSADTIEKLLRKHKRLRSKRRGRK